MANLCTNLKVSVLSGQSSMDHFITKVILLLNRKWSWLVLSLGNWTRNIMPFDFQLTFWNLVRVINSNFNPESKFATFVMQNKL
jgi:hypothetical protein